MDEAKLILLTMVKNESRIIKRLMDSVKGKADAIVVCDTGSTDNTTDLAKEYLKDNKVLGGVYEFPFVNFGKSRSKSFECCQAWVRDKGWDPKICWALLLDGDMMLKENDVIDKKKLFSLSENIAGVSLKQHNGSLVYQNVRLIRCSEPWICKGATHEAWTCPPNKSTTTFDTPVLADLNDGGCKADKYPRDVRLLLEDLEEMPNDARTHFYLGQTYMCMGDWENAIKMLKRRIEIGGWEEEVYIAYCYLGECYMSSGKKADATRTWLEGWQYRQHRTEIPVKLIEHYRREHKMQFIAGMFLEKLYQTQFGEDLRSGVKVGNPVVNNDGLFVNKRNTDYHIWEEMGILSFYCGLQRPCWLRLDNLDVTCRLNWHEFNSIFGNLHWYDWTLKPVRSQRLKIPLKKLPWLDEDESHVWQPFNPSIRVKGDKSGYDLNLRYANYYTNEAKHYGFRGFDGKVLTRNLFCQVSKSSADEFDWNNPSSMDEILIDPKYKQDGDSHIQGMEDCRLIQNSDELEFLGTSKSYADNGINKIFHVTKDKKQEEKTWNIQQMPLPPCSHPTECQKNWMGFRHKPTSKNSSATGELLYIYSFTPLRICDASGNIKVFFDTYDCGGSNSNNNENAYSIKEFRGSAGPVEWSSSAYPDEQYLCVMHKVQIGGDGRRYYHRFMTLDKDLKPSRVSCFVRMTKERVEYWSGMCKSIDSESYLVTYGLKDSEAYIAEMKASDIEELMFYNVQDAKKSVSMEARMKVLESKY